MRYRTSARASAPLTRTSASPSGTGELCDLPAERVRVGTALEEIVHYNEAREEYGRGQFDTLLDRLSAPERRDRPDVYERRRPDGTMLEVSTSPLPSGGFVAAYTDVTERYRAAAALR